MNAGKDNGLIPLTLDEAKRHTQKEIYLTSYIFVSGYEPKQIAGTLCVDLDMLMFALVFKNRQAQKEWRVFENKVDEITRQSVGNLLAYSNEDKFYKVINTKKLFNWIEEQGRGVSGFLDLNTGIVLKRATH